MPDGELRRPPQPWESRLSQMTSAAAGVGVSSGDATAIVTPTPTPGTDGGVEPAPVLPPPGSFIKPSTPSLLGQPQGINVLWNGLNATGDLWPYDTSFVEIHMSTAGTAFTPGTATLKGRLARPGSYSVGGLTAGTTYYFRLMGADPAGNYTEPSDAASGQTGQVISGDLGVGSVGTAQISFNARTIGGVTNSVQSSAPSNPLQGDVWLDTSPGTAVIHKVYDGATWVTNAWGSASIAAGQITALQLAAGAVTAGAITAGTINGWYIQGGTVAGNQITGGTITGGFISGGTVSSSFISGGTVSGGLISGGTVSGARIATSSGGSRIRLADNVSGPWGTSDAIEFLDSGNQAAMITYLAGIGMDIYANKLSLLNKNGDTVPGSLDMNVYGDMTVHDVVTVKGNLVGEADISADRFISEANAIQYNGYRTTTAAGDVILRLRSNVTTTAEAKFEVDADGDVKSRTNSYAGFSDARYKENVTPARDYLDDLRQVDIVTFNWQGSDQKLLGVTAQQLQPIFPNMVAEDEDGTLSVRYSVFVPMLITAVQSLADKVDELTARIEALEGN